MTVRWTTYWGEGGGRLRVVGMNNLSIIPGKSGSGKHL